MNWKYSALFIGVLGWSSLGGAAVSKPTAPSTLSQRQIGGMAGAGFSLLNIDKISSEKTAQERLIFSIGDKEGHNLDGAPGYFNVQNKGTQITIDFAQMSKSKLDEKDIREMFKGSKYIRSIRLVQDPMDQTLTLILDTYKPVKVRTLQVKGQKQTARVVLDISQK